jgi:hypothetical protein
LSERVSEYNFADILGLTDPSLNRYNPIGYFLLGLRKGPGILSKSWSYDIAFASVTPQMLENTWREIEYRLDIVRAKNGADIEMF